jgi:hypothetical protein
MGKSPCQVMEVPEPQKFAVGRPYLAAEKVRRGQSDLGPERHVCRSQSTRRSVRDIGRRSREGREGLPSAKDFGIVPKPTVTDFCGESPVDFREG